ncbi:MAG TPA: GNAT family N-acetyltransferase, partial [Polyangiales bacterium]
MLRTAVLADWPAVESLLRVEGLPIAGAHAHFASFLVAEFGRELVGSAGLELYLPFALLRSVTVAPPARRRGLGRRIVEHALRSARANRVQAVYLLTTNAEAYFSRLDFKPLSRERVPL